ncbi:MAG: hypothetical protein HZC24_07320 [Rhodocyclales bacterium]|nr:hypothetical protein [Rhodocyclales bacterium]
MKALIPAIGLVALMLFSAAASAGPEEDFAAADALFQKARGGDGEATAEAVARFERLAAADTPYAPLYLAYQGAAQTLQGRDAWMPWTKMRATERGLATLDKALRRLEARHDTTLLRQAPVAAEVRLGAATTYLAVPGLFNRFDAAKAALRAAFASPAYAAAPPALRAELHRRAAEAAARDNKREEEIEQLKKAAAAEPTGATAAAARQRLQELGS